MPTTTIEGMESAPLITLENITVRLRDRPYLQNTSWEINSNEHWAMLGPNGSGKTTFARSLIGAVPIVKGKITYHFSKADRRNPAVATDKIGYVSPEMHRDIIKREYLQDRFRDFSGLIDEFTSVKQLILNQTVDLQRRGPQDEKTFDRVARQTGIEALLQRDIKSLSTGEMNAVLIAKALIKNPKLLILDEPFDGLDKKSRDFLTEAISALARDGIQLIMITHRFEEIVPEISHVMLLKQGQIYMAGRKENVFKPQIIDAVYETEKQAGPPNGRKLNSALPPLEGKRKPLSHDREAGNPQILIEMKDVTVKYGSRLILDKFNWVVKQGENWVILGPQASGKSTVLTLIRGDNLQAYANDIHLFGKKRGTGESIWEIRKKIGYISSDLQLRQHKNVDALDVVCSGFFDSNGLYRNCSRDELSIARAWIQFLDVADLAGQKFGRLSHGQRQLVLIGRAMVKSPEFLILDEPFQGLDIKNKAKLRSAFEYIGSNTHTNLIYVPDQEEEKLNCITHVMNMKRGKAISTRALRT
jgi:molybdate transport system ATP-binding protein